jgi:hypothetical protein
MTGGTKAVPLDAATVASYDAALIASDHHAIAYKALVGEACRRHTQSLCPRGRGRHVVKARQETGRSRLGGRSRWSSRL